MHQQNHSWFQGPNLLQIKMNMQKFGFNLALLIRIIYNKCSKCCLTPQA